MPNITGSFSLRPDAQGGQPVTGAFVGNNTGNAVNQTVAQEVHLKEYILSFDASRCSVVYGNAETVQPPALQLIPQIRF